MYKSIESIMKNPRNNPCNWNMLGVQIRESELSRRIQIRGEELLNLFNNLQQLSA